MVKQIVRSLTPLQNVLILVLIVGLAIAVFTAVTVMVLGDNNMTVNSRDTSRLMLTEPPTPSVTSSITNGVYMQDPKTKQYKKVTPDTNAVTIPANSAIGRGSSLISSNDGGRATGLALYTNPALRAQGRQERIASQPTGVWFGGWNTDVAGDVSRVVAAAKGSAPILVAYNIPHRDCGSYSAGGSTSSASYREWIQAFANGIGRNKAIVILEPDALAGLDCLQLSGQNQRLSDIAFAVSTLSRTGSSTYIDAGNYTWQPASVMAQRLKAANVAGARGFSLNVSGYGWTDKSIAYGKQLIAAGAGSGFVIDTSRNGNGPAPGNEWCNPRGRGLGINPTTSTAVANLDAYLWVKVPGESDGTCGGGPPAGEWWNEMADELIRNAKQ